MTNNTGTHHKPFIEELVLGLLPHEFIRTSFLFIFRARPFFDDVKANNWDGKLHPAAFLLASLMIAGLLDPFVGPYGRDPKWYESHSEMEVEYRLELREAFPFTPQEKNTFRFESIAPNLTAASQRIKTVAGSLDVDKIALHLAEKNPELAKALARGADEINKFNKYVTLLKVPSLFLSLAIGALVIHLILRQASGPYRLAYYVLSYFQGFWLAFSYLMVAVGQFAIPYEFSLLSLLYVIFSTIAFIASLVHGCWICGFVYSRGIGRRLLAFVLGYTAMLAALVTVGMGLVLIVDHLP